MKRENAEYHNKFIKSHGLEGEAKSTFKSQSRHTMKGAKHKALEGVKSKMFREVTKKRLETSPSYKEASRMSKIHQEQWKKKGL